MLKSGYITIFLIILLANRMESRSVSGMLEKFIDVTAKLFERIDITKSLQTIQSNRKCIWKICSHPLKKQIVTFAPQKISSDQDFKSNFIKGRFF